MRKNPYSRTIRLAFLAAGAVACFSAAKACSGQTGVASLQPSSGRSVACDNQFLVEYRQRIPGSEAAFDMAPIPAGVVALGSPASEPGRADDEGPVRKVQCQAFWIGKFEVTWAEYKQYMRLCDVFEKFDDQAIRPILDSNRVDAITAPSKLYEPSFTYESGDDPRLPAVSMSQYAAKQYTKWLSLTTGVYYRLPTEAEWEYACRAGSTGAYSYGDSPSELDKHAWHEGNSDSVAHPVGEKSPNPWGLHDMHGNASEWVLDAYSEEGYSHLPAKGVATIAQAIRWPKRLYPRVLRGGSCLSDPEACRSAARLASDDEEWRIYDPNSPQSPWWYASDEALAIGFRVVRPWPQPTREEMSKYWDADLKRIQQIADYRIDEEGRGRRGVVDSGLPDAIKALAE